MAAALAVVLQGDVPLLLDPEQDRPAVDERPDRNRERPDRGAERGPRESRRPRGRSDVEMATYRIAVGKRHRVEPRQIVGALANEGGLGRDDFGHIDIRVDHSLVELPADLPAAVREALQGTRISGKLIELSLERGGRANRSAGPDKVRSEYRGKGEATKPRSKYRG